MANLPWVLGNGEASMIFGYAYPEMLRKAPEKFREGTIRDLLLGKKFGTVIVTQSNSSYVPEPGELAGYELVERRPGYEIFQKRK